MAAYFSPVNLCILLLKDKWVELNEKIYVILLLNCSASFFLVKTVKIKMDYLLGFDDLQLIRVTFNAKIGEVNLCLQ